MYINVYMYYQYSPSIDALDNHMLIIILHLQVKRMQVRVESLIEGKQSDVSQVCTLTTRIEELATQLQASQAAYTSIVQKNTELTAMLHDVEEKGSKIGKMAKEKLTKYKAENDELKARLSQTGAAAAAAGEGDVVNSDVSKQLVAASEEKRQLEERIGELQSKLDEKEARYESSQTAITEHTAQISGLKDVIEKLQSNSASIDGNLTQDLIETKQENASLKAKVASLTAQAEQLSLKLDESDAGWAKQKTELEADLAEKTTQMSQLRTELSDKLQVLDECENKMATEKSALSEQMAAQSTETEELRAELTKLSSLLEQAGFYEVSSSQ